MTARSAIAASVLILASGCTGLSGRIGKNFDQADRQAATLLQDVGGTAEGIVKKRTSVAAHEEGVWLGAKAMKFKEPSLPAVFFQPTTFDRTVASLSEVAERITLRSGIPVKVSPEVLNLSTAGGTTTPGTAGINAPGASASPSNPAARLPMPGDTQIRSNPIRQTGPIRITYNGGTFKGFLDTVAARFGVYWKYTDGSLQFFHTDSRTFQINAVPGDSTFTATVASGATSSSSGGATGGSGSNNGLSANNAQNTSVASQLSVFSSIEKSILTMLSPYGKTVASAAMGTITVVDTPDVLDRVATFIETQNKALSRQVVINVTVLAVTLSDSDEYGINWNLVYTGLRNRYGIQNSFTTSNGSSSFSAGVLDTSNSSFAGTNLIVRALSEQGKVRRYTSASVVTLNNQPVPLQVARQTSYLQSSQTSIAAQVGATTTLTPGTVTSGFNMSILPHVLDNGTVLLQFSTDISSLRSIRTVTSNNGSIETPEVDTRNFLQRVAMKSNQTLIISGFEQTSENIDQRGAGHPANFLMGGGQQAALNREIIVILITPSATAGT